MKNKIKELENTLLDYMKAYKKEVLENQKLKKELTEVKEEFRKCREAL